MAELTYDQFSGHGDLTEMATQINAALEKITDRLDKLDDGGSGLLDPTSQGLAINLADGFGRNLEAYLNNPNKKMLGDWILEGTLRVNGPMSVYGDLTVNGTSNIIGTMTVAGDLQLSTGIFTTSDGGTFMEIDADTPHLMEYTTQKAGELYPGVVGLYSDIGSQYEYRIRTPINSFGSGNTPTVSLLESYAGSGIDSNIQLASDKVTTTGVILGPSGSAGAPSHSFSTDPDLGWYRKTTNTAALSCGGTEELIVSTEQFWAHSVYSRTTGTAANVNVNSLGELRRNTSSRRYKEDIRPLTDSEADLALQLEPVRYRSATGDGASLHTFDGLISEDVAKVNPRWADYSATPDCDCACDDDAEMWEHDETCLVPEGVQYQAIIPALLSLIKRQDARITELESKIQ